MFGINTNPGWSNLNNKRDEIMYDWANDMGNGESFFPKIAIWGENQLTGNLDWQRELEMTDRTMSFNAAEAQKERDWSEHMRDTSLTSQYNQAKALGINPYIALGAGGASAPSGAVASANGSHRFASGQGPASALSSILSTLTGGAFRLVEAVLDNKASKLRSDAADEVKRASSDMMSARRLQAATERLNFDKRRYADYKASKEKDKKQSFSASGINKLFQNLPFDEI